MGACTFPVLSTRYSIFPALISATALPTSKVTVPALGVGIRPRGPRIRPSGPTFPMRSGVATATSNSTQPFWICSRIVEPHVVGPCLQGLLLLLALGDDQHPDVLPRSVGKGRPYPEPPGPPAGGRRRGVQPLRRFRRTWRRRGPLRPGWHPVGEASRQQSASTWRLCNAFRVLA